MASEYVESLRKKELDEYEKQTELGRFRQKFKGRIEQGLTEAELKSEYQCRERDIELFREVKEEVDREAKLGAAFLEGFNNPNFMADRKGGK